MRMNPMRFKILMTFGAWMMLAGAVASAGEKAADADPAVEPAAQEAAAQALKEMGSQPGPRLAGMPSAQSMDRAALGQPFAVKMVQLDELTRFQSASTSDAEALLHDLQTAV